MKMSSTPATANASASPTVATVMPTAPAASWRRAISADLCVLTCGRTTSPRRAAVPAIALRLASSTSVSTTTAGVTTAPGSCESLTGCASAGRARGARRGLVGPQLTGHADRRRGGPARALSLRAVPLAEGRRPHPGAERLLVLPPGHHQPGGPLIGRLEQREALEPELAVDGPRPGG